MKHENDPQEQILRLREENELFRRALAEAECGRLLLRQREEFSLLLEVGRAIVSELNLKKVLNLVADKARRIIDAETMVVPVINERRDRYTYLAAAGAGAADLLGRSFKIRVGMCGWVLNHERPLLFGEPDQWWMEEKTAWEEGQQSALLVPLFGRRRIIGGLSGLGKLGGGSFTEHDLDLLTLFASQVSTAIENAGLFQEKEAVIDALESEKERLAVTLRSIGDGVITTDTTGNVILLNKVAEELTGWSQAEAAGRPVAEVFRIINEKTGRQCEDPVAKVLNSGKIVGLANHTILVARDGRRRSIADSGAPIRDRQSRILGTVLVFRDVTEKNRLEEEALKGKKLESVGLLAGGLAHDFNNILVAVLGNLSLAAEIARQDAAIHPLLVEAEKATLRAKGLTQQLLTFSKGGAPVKKLASIAEVIKESCRFVLRGSNVRCEDCFADHLWPVEMDTGQISQVIQNLVLNACHAMPAGGVIHIRCENVATGSTEHPALSAGPYVKIVIRDQGIGIAPELLDRIFDPYFTTKQQGSGLGLAITYSIIRKHQGHILAKSEQGRGTTFTIYLPARPESEPETEGEAGPVIKEGQGRILLMDDEEIVRKVARSMLTRFGYKVIQARDGEEAITCYREADQSGHPFDLVIMDLTIPGGMGGIEAVGRILALNPQARVIVSSGYSNDPVMAHFQDYGFRAAIVKPYQLQELLEVVGRTLA